jgi:hypothetical protein
VIYALTEEALLKGLGKLMPKEPSTGGGRGGEE